MVSANLSDKFIMSKVETKDHKNIPLGLLDIKSIFFGTINQLKLKTFQQELHGSRGRVQMPVSLLLKTQACGILPITSIDRGQLKVLKNRNIPSQCK